MERMEWEELNQVPKMIFASANSGKLGKPPPFLNTYFLICKLRIMSTNVQD